VGGRSVYSALLLLLALGASGCGSREGASGGPYGRRVAREIPRIERATGLTFKSPPKVEQRTRQEVRTFLEQRFTEDLPPEELSGMERVYKRFGLLPANMDLRQFMLDLLTEQVAGYYDPKTKVLYVVEGSDATIAGVTIAHELVHALQDQYFDLDSLQSARDDNDRAMAAQAVIEGQATLEQIASMLGSENVVAALPGGWERVRQMIRESQGGMPIFASAPLILQETLLFPYLSGAEFMRRYKEAFPGQPPFGRMPSSTEQVLHSDRYFESRDEPVAVVLPAPLRGKVAYQNNLGEFETRLLLFEYLQDQGAAMRGAAGWDGDRYALLDLGSGEALLWVSVWDSAVDGAEFFDLLGRGLERRYGQSRGGASDTRTFRARGRDYYLQITALGGQTIVYYADIPQGTVPRLIELSRVVLRQ
jgi:hypothetical protein